MSRSKKGRARFVTKGSTLKEADSKANIYREQGDPEEPPLAVVDYERLHSKWKYESEIFWREFLAVQERLCAGCKPIFTDEVMKAQRMAFGQRATDLQKSAETKVVCLSGSSRFVDKMAVFGWELEKRGVVVMGLHLLPQWYAGVKPDHQAEAEGVRETMDQLHLRKIDMADEVFVYNEGRYIGESTRKELKYAREQQKPIRFLEDDLSGTICPYCDKDISGPYRRCRECEPPKSTMLCHEDELCAKEANHEGPCGFRRDPNDPIEQVCRIFPSILGGCQ